MTHSRVLFADPVASTREDVLQGLQENLRDVDLSIEVCDSVSDAESVIADGPVDCVITEYDLGDGTGFDLLQRARTAQPDTSGILFTAAEYDDLDVTASGPTITEYLDRRSADAVQRLADLVRGELSLPGQTSYPHPTDEPGRLAALAAYDDDAPGLAEALQYVTELVARYFETPNVEVNLIGKHLQESFTHSDDATFCGSVPREDSICTFTILEPDSLLAVHDVREDPRFETNARLAEAGLRSYLGAPLVTPDGFAIGTVCVWTTGPRTFDEAEMAYLRSTAQLTMHLFEGLARHDDRNSASSARGDCK